MKHIKLYAMITPFQKEKCVIELLFQNNVHKYCINCNFRSVHFPVALPNIVPWVGLQCMNVGFSGHSHLHFFKIL